MSDNLSTMYLIISLDIVIKVNYNKKNNIIYKKIYFKAPRDNPLMRYFFINGSKGGSRDEHKIDYTREYLSRQDGFDTPILLGGVL